MKEVKFFSESDLELMSSSIQLSKKTWLLWIKADAVPEGHDGFEMLESLSDLEQKLDKILNPFPAGDDEQLRNALPNNIFQFPNNASNRSEE